MVKADETVVLDSSAYTVCAFVLHVSPLPCGERCCEWKKNLFFHLISDVCIKKKDDKWKKKRKKEEEKDHREDAVSE